MRPYIVFGTWKWLKLDDFEAKKIQKLHNAWWFRIWIVREIFCGKNS